MGEHGDTGPQSQRFFSGSLGICLRKFSCVVLSKKLESMERRSSTEKDT